MATKRSTFQKRQRETDLKDKARAKDARRAAKRERDRNPPPPEAAADAPVDGAPPADTTNVAPASTASTSAAPTSSVSTSTNPTNNARR